MAFSKITDDMRAGKGNVGQPDTPGVTTTEMQEIMDALPNLAIDGHNAHIDELGLNTAATNLGALVPQGITANENIQSVLSALAILVLTCDRDRHTHPNKEILDSITQAVKSGYDDVVQLMRGISAIQQNITAVDSGVPTSNAVISYIDALDISRKVVNAAYPIGTVYMTTESLSPAATLGYGEWEQLGQTDQYGISRYTRIG